MNEIETMLRIQKVAKSSKSQCSTSEIIDFGIIVHSTEPLSSSSPVLDEETCQILCYLIMPEYGINDVLIKVKRTAICGTDIHIYKWDEWAQKTIPVPMVVGLKTLPLPILRCCTIIEFSNRNKYCNKEP